jgi:3,4-dihydroxy 2-butanone 4-phosphate synthase/GTP cyclohydrolase II
MALSSIEDAIKDFAEGKLIIVVDDEDRENEGDLILAAEKATPENIAFMIRHTSGIICAPAEEERLNELELPIMVEQNSDPLRTAFTVSTDYMRGMTTGVSAVERANTLRALADGSVAAADFIKPGHIFPLRYRAGGVLVRSGHTEAAIDLCKLAGLKSVGALAELNHDDGTMMRMPALIEFAEAHGLHIISIESLIKYRAEHDVLVSEIATSEISLNGANYQAHVYKTVFDGKLITAIVKGNIESETPTLVRVIKGSNGRDFMSSAMVEGNVISNSLKLIADAPQGVFIYLPASEETEVEDEQSGAVWREVGLGSHILSSLGVRRIHLLASKELTYPGISSFGLHIETIIKED